jgi:hypothetical protein
MQQKRADKREIGYFTNKQIATFIHKQSEMQKLNATHQQDGATKELQRTMPDPKNHWTTEKTDDRLQNSIPMDTRALPQFLHLSAPKQHGRHLRFQLQRGKTQAPSLAVLMIA